MRNSRLKRREERERERERIEGDRNRRIRAKLVFCVSFHCNGWMIFAMQGRDYFVQREILFPVYSSVRA